MIFSFPALGEGRDGGAAALGAWGEMNVGRRFMALHRALVCQTGLAWLAPIPVIPQKGKEQGGMHASP